MKHCRVSFSPCLIRMYLLLLKEKTIYLRHWISINKKGEGRGERGVLASTLYEMGMKVGP